MIKPYIGQKVWYWPSANDKTGPVPMYQQADQPLDATIIAVHGDRMVNVLVTDTMGRQFPVLSCDMLDVHELPCVSHDGSLVGRYVEPIPARQADSAEQ